MTKPLILNSVVILNLLIAPAFAQQGADAVRVPVGLALIEAESAPVSYDAVSKEAANAFAVMDIDGDGKVELGELKAWRNNIEVRDGEDLLKTLLGLGSERLMQSVDHNGDKAISLPEARALALYDFSVHDADNSGALVSDELDEWQPTLVQWAARPCLKFGVGEGMLVGAFCGK